ncbi:MAG: flavodoxin [Anaerovoracaceae bacterium]
MSNILVAYYSRPYENYVNGRIVDLEVGNTEVAAKMVAEETGGDLFRIDQKKPYSKDYNECIEEARADQSDGARPELKSVPESIDGYDTICLGYPNYWSTMPMAVFTFLEAFDFSGKTILPFCTNEGSGMGRSERDIRSECPGADVRKGLSIHGADAAGSGPAIAKWIGKNVE